MPRDCPESSCARQGFLKEAWQIILLA
jgi:hypothetical protein